MLVTKLALAQSAIKEVNNCLRCIYGDLYDDTLEHSCIEKYTQSYRVLTTPTKYELR